MTEEKIVAQTKGISVYPEEEEESDEEQDNSKIIITNIQICNRAYSNVAIILDTTAIRYFSSDAQIKRHK
jgi:hypothetical protein